MSKPRKRTASRSHPRVRVDRDDERETPDGRLKTALAALFAALALAALAVADWLGRDQGDEPPPSPEAKP